MYAGSTSFRTKQFRVRCSCFTVSKSLHAPTRRLYGKWRKFNLIHFFLRHVYFASVSSSYFCVSQQFSKNTAVIKFAAFTCSEKALLPRTVCSAAEMMLQEAQLSQRDRAMLRVIEYFAKSLKVIRKDTLEKDVSYY